MKLNGKDRSLVDNGLFIPKSIVKIINIETIRKNGHVIVEENPYLPDSIYQISEGQIKIPIANHADKTVVIPTSSIKYSYIKINETRKRVQTISSEEYKKRITLLLENSRLSHIEKDLMTR